MSLSSRNSARERTKTTNNVFLTAVKTSELDTDDKSNIETEHIAGADSPDEGLPNSPSHDGETKEQEDNEDDDLSPDEYEDSQPWRGNQESWTAQKEPDSDDYETDLEDDFPEESSIPVDASGKYVYEDKCIKSGFVPVQYLLRNMGEGNLRMRHHYIGGPATRPLADALRMNTICEEIDLSDNYIEGQGARAIAAMLRENMFIVNLNVSHNFIRSEGADAFAKMLESNTTLKTLSLEGNQLNDEDAKRIGEAMKQNMSLTCLNLSHNEFCERGGICIGAGLTANIGLLDLDLSWNHIRENGAISIAKALQKNASLEILDLSWNGISENGAKVLGQSLKVNKALRVLDISNNRLSTEAAKHLGLGIARNKGLETLLMGLNPIGDEGVEAILKGIEKNSTIKLVGIEGCTDIKLAPKLQEKVNQMESARDIMIMCSSASPSQARISSTVLAVFDRFLRENEGRMEDLFNQMDKDHSGDVTLEELKYGLKDFGLRLTSRQLDMLLDELDADKSGTIEYDELMSGSIMVKREKEKQMRACKDAELLKEAQLHDQAISDMAHSAHKQKRTEAKGEK